MTFPYGTVLRDSTDGEVVMILRARDSDMAFWSVLILVEPDPATTWAKTGDIEYRSVDGPTWERLP